LARWRLQTAISNHQKYVISNEGWKPVS